MKKLLLKITELKENCVYVELLEYNNMKGIIERGEISRRRIQNIPNMVKINNIEVIKVISIDKENNNVYLSRRQAELNETNNNKIALIMQNIKQ
jgi:translation initiation factor 2 alpha subunit (eIF-2alpha)